jgi:hypothetical protein
VQAGAQWRLLGAVPEAMHAESRHAGQGGRQAEDRHAEKHTPHCTNITALTSKACSTCRS